ncbi:MAG: tRNA pseudouridine(38-40) synthase TruA [Pseudomonadota bacterium]
MPRYALKIEYHGAAFSGWQAQADVPSVQGKVEAALRQLDASVDRIAAAGRTDAGVHATGQVAHVDMSRAWDPFRLSEALNFHLKPAPVAVLAAAKVAPDWHARFSAQERRYSYRIICRRAPLAFAAGTAWHVRRPLDVDAMQAAGRHLIGQHDFTTFRSSICQAKSPVKTIDAIEFDAMHCTGGSEIVARFRARSFLHHQVRSIIGTLERVGAGAWPAERVRDALVAADRAACGPVAPADGLVLTGVSYPEDPFKADTAPSSP